MPRKQGVPKYNKHRNGQAYSKYKGKFYYWGKYGTEASQEAYHRFLATIRADLPEDEPPEVNPSKIKTVNAIADSYTDWTATEYGTGRHNSEHFAIGRALGPLLSRYGSRVPADVGPVEFQQIQQDMVARGWSRGTINQHIGRLKRFFRWMVANAYIKPSVLYAVQSVSNLRKGRTLAPEPGKVRAVSLETVQATLPYLNPVVQTMVQVQLYCGLRPTELCIMRPKDINRAGGTWLYLPESHKNDWRDHGLLKGVPLVAQQLLEPYLNREPDKYCFSPAESWELIGRKVNAKAKVKPGERYNDSSYCKAVKYAFAKAEKKGVILDRWHPMQLRHAIATLLSQHHGEQTAQRWLGHASLQTTGIYSERQQSEIIQIAGLVDRLFQPEPDA